MKKNKLALLCYFLCIVFYSCSSQTDTKDFIPGIYVREVKNEFSVGRDTLVISPFNTNTFSIIHKGSYQRIKNGKLKPVERKYENWTATYDNNKQVLQEIKKGKVFLFDQSKNILFVGKSPYKKIK